MAEKVHQPLIRETNRLPRDHKKFVSPKQLVRLLRKLAAEIAKARTDSRWHCSIKFRAYAKARGIR